MNRTFAAALLLLCALLWGMAFIAQKSAMQYMTPLTFSFVRYFLGAFLVTPLALAEYRRQRNKGLVVTQRAMVADRHTEPRLLCRRLAATGRAADHLGHQWRLPDRALRHPDAGRDLRHAAHPPASDRLSRRAARHARHLSAHRRRRHQVHARRHHAAGGRGMLGGAGRAARRAGQADRPAGLHLGHQLLRHCGAGNDRRLRASSTRRSAPSAAAGSRSSIPGVFSTGVAFTLQAIGQQYVPPANAAIVLSSESLFAAFGGAVIFGERLPPLGYVGAAIIFVAIILVEAIPALRARRLVTWEAPGSG